MRAHTILAAAGGIALFLAACGGDAELADGGNMEPTAASTASSAAGAVTGEVGDGGRLVSADGRLEVQGSGRSLEVTIEVVAEVPDPPGGWELIAPVFEVSAMDRSTAVSRLSEPLVLRFKADGLATILYFNGDEWEVVPSTLEEDGSVSASIEHLSPYSVGRPGNAGSIPTAGAATVPTRPATDIQAPTPRATITKPGITMTVPAGNPRAQVTPPSFTPGATATSATVTPGSKATAAAITPGAAVTVTVGETDPATAKAVLEAAIKLYKQRSVAVTAAAGYSAGGAVALPPAISDAVASIAASGTLSYGIYGGINEAVTSDVSASSGTGSFTFLAEPKTSMPATADAALSALLASFPGAEGHSYGAASTGAPGYVFTAVEGDQAYVLGFAEYEGVAIAYLCAGSGSYYGATVAFSAP